MATYSDEASAAADGLLLGHDESRHRFVVTRDGDVVGEAHYSLIGSQGIDFDHTLVEPALRGTGLSEVLARYALTDDLVKGRAIHASCWFIDAYLRKHPELAETGV